MALSKEEHILYLYVLKVVATGGHQRPIYECEGCYIKRVILHQSNRCL